MITTMRFVHKIDDPGEPCESCGRRLWWWDSAEPDRYPGRWAELPPASVHAMGVQHDPERCRWWRGDPSTTWGEPPVTSNK